MWEKEELLVTNNFSFSHNVFKSLVKQTRKNQGLFGKGLKKRLTHGWTEGGTDGWTDGQRTITEACWPKASGAKN